MGLDMYLSVQVGNDKPENYWELEGNGGVKYVSKWRFEGPEAEAEYDAVMADTGLADLVTEDSPSAFVWPGGAEVTACYWRKSNAIHAWFVDTCQDGIDECQRTEVDVEQLAYLIALCEKELADPENAGGILTPRSGFFFGNTDIDEWYFMDLRHTVERLTFVIQYVVTNLPGAKFFYHSSW